MQDLQLNRMTADARALADQIGSQTAEALIRATSGIQQTSSEKLTTAVEGVQAAGGRIGHEVAEATQTITLPSASARTAWRAGRFVGRIEGAMKLALFGLRFWRRRQQRQKRKGQWQRSVAWVRVLAQWGPCAVASAWLTAQVWARLRRRQAFP